MGRRISAHLGTQRPDQQRTCDQQQPVDPTRVKRSLDANRMLWKAQSPDAGHGQCQKQHPEIPAAPQDAGNRQRQQRDSHRSDRSGVSQPTLRRARRGKVAKSGYEQKTRHSGNVDRSPHAVTVSSGDKRALRCVLVHALNLLLPDRAVDDSVAPHRLCPAVATRNRGALKHSACCSALRAVLCACHNEACRPAIRRSRSHQARVAAIPAPVSRARREGTMSQPVRRANRG